MPPTIGDFVRDCASPASEIECVSSVHAYMFPYVIVIANVPLGAASAVLLIGQYAIAFNARIISNHIGVIAVREHHTSSPASPSFEHEVAHSNSKRSKYALVSHTFIDPPATGFEPLDTVGPFGQSVSRTRVHRQVGRIYKRIVGDACVSSCCTPDWLFIILFRAV